MPPVGRRHNNSHWFARNGPTQSNVCVAVQFNLKMDNKSTEKWRQVFGGGGDSACRSVGDAINFIRLLSARMISRTTAVGLLIGAES